MFTPIGRPRRLPFPLQNQVTNSNEVSIDGLTPNPVTWPEDSTQRIPVILSVSLDEWNAIASAVDVGADIAYPEQYVEVTWILYRNLVYAMSICSQIIECITNDTDVQNALINMLKNSEDFTDYMNERVTAITGELIGSKIVSGSCDNSVVAGKMVAIVERLNTNNEDFFEIIEVGTNDEERVSAVIGAIPGLNETPVDEIIDMLQSLLENLSENYAAAITEAWKDEVENDLYCLAKEKVDCSLTYQDLFDYFQNRAGSELTIGALIRNVVEFVINGDFSTDELVASGMYAIQLAFILAGRDFNGINVPRIGAITRDALPSSKWEEWDPCGTPESRTPIIASVWDPTHIAGTLSGPDSEGVWTVTAEIRASDQAFVIRDVDGRDFVIQDKVYSSSPACQVWLQGGTVTHFACGVGDQYTDQVIEEFWTTWTIGALQTMQFKMVAP